MRGVHIKILLIKIKTNLMKLKLVKKLKKIKQLETLK